MLAPSEKSQNLPDPGDTTADVEESLDHYSERGRRRNYLLCRRCCRRETHVLVPSRGREFPLIVLLTLGLVYLIGPFMCVCCGHRRLFKLSFYNPNQAKRYQTTVVRSRDHGWVWEKRKNWLKKKIGTVSRVITKPIRSLFERRNMHF